MIDLGPLDDLEPLRGQIDEALSFHDYERLCTLVGRNRAPAWIARLFAVGEIESDELTPRLVASLWSGVEFPLRALPRRTWLQWFRAAGFVSSPRRRQPPAKPIEVWRSQVGRSVGMSWTRERKTAEWFQERNARYGFTARLLHGFAPPTSVLGFIDDRKEREVVIDPSARFWE